MNVSWLPVVVVDVGGAILVLIIAALCIQEAFLWSKKKPHEIFTRYLFFLVVSIGVFAVSRSVGHILKQILLHTDNTDYWRALSPYSGALNTATFISIFGLSIAFHRFHIWHEELQVHRDSLQDLVQERTQDLAKLNTALQASKNRFKLLSDLTFEGILIHHEGVAHDVNQALSRMLGYSWDEMIGKNIIDLAVPPEYHEIVKKNLLNSNPKPYEIMARRSDGTLFPIEIEARDIQEEGLRVAAVRNITERKESELALEESKKRATALLQAIPDLVFRLNREGEYLDFKADASDLHLRGEISIVGRDYHDLMPADLHALTDRMIEQTLKTGEMQTFEYQLSTLDGDPVDYEARMVRSGEDEVTVIVRDITSRLELEKQLRQSQKLETIGTMVGGIAHDFNNILQSMFLYAGIVQANLPKEKILRKNFQHILDDGLRARDLVDQILTFSRKNELKFESQTIHEIIIEALTFERASLPANIELILDIDESCGSVLCDKTQMHQIMLNLCNNAKHALEEKGGTIRVSLHQTEIRRNISSAKPPFLELKINDNGHGMKQETIDRIFDPFYTTKEIGKGTGLGLSVIHGIVEMMGGKISVTSEPGIGSEFTIRLPVIERHEPVLEAEPNKQTGVHPLTILLVDDEHAIRISAQEMLAIKGHIVDVASDGSTGLDLFKANPEKYDLIVTDLSMPKMNGVELSREIRNLGFDTSIILSSGNLTTEKMEFAKKQGITNFIMKPWTVDQLIQLWVSHKENRG